MEMLSGLSRLASRKLVEAKARTTANIACWEAMIALIRRTGNEAEVKISLPDQLNPQIAKACDELKTANYLTALKIDQQSVEAQQKARAFALQCLRSAESQHADAASSAKSSIANATAIRDRKVNSANEEKSRILREADSIRSATHHDGIFTKSAAAAPAGCGVSVLVCIVSMTYSDLTHQPHITGFPAFITLVYGFFGWIGVPVTVFLLQLCVSIVKSAQAGSRAASMGSKAETLWRTATIEAESEFDRTVSSPTSILAKSENLRQKACNAVKVLEKD